MLKDNFKTLKYAYLIAGFIAGVFLVGANVILAAPTLNILGNRAVVGGTATTTDNANFTASGTVSFPTLGSSGNPCLVVGSTGLVATSTCGSGGITAAATTTDGINVATTTNTLTLSLRNTLATLSGLSTSTNNIIYGSDASGWLVTNTTSTEAGILGLGSNAYNSTAFLTSAITSLGGQTGATQTFSTTTAGIGISSATNNHALSLRDVLVQISGLGTTKGNLMVGNSGGTAYTALGVGTSGYVLTASSSATNGVSWEAAGGGTLTGTGQNTYLSKWTSATNLSTTTITEVNSTTTVIGDLIVDSGATGTSTLAIGQSGNQGCIEVRDRDNGAWSYAYFIDGIMYVDTGQCGQ